MSKMDDLRAMREARYAARGTAASPAKPAAAPTKPPRQAASRPTPDPTPTAMPTAALCGHRAISGRTCTREHGHAAKSHRYS